MAIDKLPQSAVRSVTVKAGAKAVEQKLVTQAELDKLLKNPSLGPNERAEAKTLIGQMRARAAAFNGNASAVEKLAKALGAEGDAGSRVDAARHALSIGALTEKQFHKLTGDSVGFLASAQLSALIDAARGDANRLND